MTRRMSVRHHRGSAGQGLVEFALTVPVFMVLLLGMLEFGFAFAHDQTLTYATREGARTGAALATGNTGYPCTTSNFDAPVIAAVERVLDSPGSQIAIKSVPSIAIYLANPTDGSPTAGKVNTWTLYVDGSGNGLGPTVDGQKLHFKPPASMAWAPCSRSNGDPADALGVALTYNYSFITPLGGILQLIGGSGASSLQMSDRTVMNLNPTAQ